MKLSWLGSPLQPAGTERGWARGYAFVDGERCLEDHEIAEYLARERARLPAAAAALNGCFTAVLDGDPAPVLVSDRYATVPLYLHRGDGEVLASTDPWQVIGALDARPELDPLAALDLLRLGYVLGTRTLITGVETLAPATIAALEHRSVREARYWRYGYRPERMAPADAIARLAAVFASIGARTARHLSARGRHPALTLSGGLDSRVLAAVLSQAYQGELTALSYGAPGNPEVEVAREVASGLGMKFRSVAIGSDYLGDAFLARSVREVGATTRFTCGVGARHLDAADIDVLIPGHTGDFITGGHLPAQVGMVRTRTQLLHYLAFQHCRYLGSEAILRRIVHVDYDALKWRTLHASTSDFDFADDVFGLIDRWNVENRQRRLILMELRAYEQLGRWMLPFYDHELVDFYAVVPHELRVAQNLYIETALQRLFTGRAQGLADARRIGSRSMRIDPALAGRIARLQRLQPLSGWFLECALPAYRDLSRRLQPKPASQIGTDPLRAWFTSDPAAREFVLARVAALDAGLFDARAFAAVLESEGQDERVYNRLMPAALTIQESLDQARASWERSRARRA